MAEQKDEDLFGGDVFDNWDEVEPGHIISKFPSRLRYRQGADVSNWIACGGTKYLPRNWFMQCGAQKDTFTARKFGGIEVTFPTPFGDNPIFLCNVIATLPVFEAVYALQAVAASRSVMEVYWWSVNNFTRVYFNWLAIGPVGL